MDQIEIEDGHQEFGVYKRLSAIGHKVERELLHEQAAIWKRKADRWVSDHSGSFDITLCRPWKRGLAIRWSSRELERLKRFERAQRQGDWDSV